ncbi:porin [Burkholderia cenocepacia]|jgi:predicted porin|uniref:porin n=1 Tax=Burkholderia cenocepacia TaxID=95486 RepID=UPI0004F80B66|nr:porin [Burkholderia cenocepacia]AIO44413.1 gram-negative porin family protein [Burkholderia cepacia]KGC01705.1 gram-negative porin family protein [Burkholderia cepacia]MCG0576883.1 porin [Burkholderia cenocepacia]MCW3523437.1 porin [Burkholderia cenocepacia]MCW3618254.1 porin [Burkholderia cenocepacia]
MNKTLIVAAVAASFATAAHAQSSVTLYGVLDAGITYQSNVQTASGQGKSRWSLGSGIDQSRFGLRGSEDLGGGLKAIFTLESGFNIGNGKFANGNGGMFNRQAFVGLSSQYGTVTLGKQYDATQDYLAPLTATGSWGGTYFAHPLNNDRLSTNGDVALNNTIKYTSVNYAGLQFGGTYSFSNSTNFANNRAYSAGLSYQFEGLKLGAAYSQANNAGLSTTGAVNPSIDSTTGTAFGVQGRTRTYGIAAGYAFGPAQVGAAWTQSRLDNQTSGAGTLRADNYEINGKYNLTPALGLGAAYTYTSAKQNGQSTHWNQFGVQADYSLSKRTDVYAQAVYQRGTKGAGFGASIYNGDVNAYPSSKVSQTAATVGLRHRF